MLAARGWSVTIVTATPGDCGSADLPADEIASIRRREAAAAANLIGADYRCLEERDLAIDYNTAARRRFTEVVRSLRPTIIFTHPLIDYMADHEIVGRLVRDACFAAPMPNFRASGDSAPLDAIPHLYYCDPFMGGGEAADSTEIVDVSSAMETKRLMLAEHRSQRDWLRRQHGIDEYMRLQEELAKARGALLCVPFAEGFSQHRGHPYPQNDLLSEALAAPLAREGGGL